MKKEFDDLREEYKELKKVDTGEVQFMNDVMLISQVKAISKILVEKDIVTEEEIEQEIKEQMDAAFELTNILTGHNEGMCDCGEHKDEKQDSVNIDEKVSAE